MKVQPLIPCYNISISEFDLLLESMPLVYEKPLIITNGVSRDVATYLDKLKNSNTIDLIILPFQIGKAETIRQGLRHILTKNIDIVVQIDGRNKQLCNQTISHCELVKDGFDLVLSNRYHYQDVSNQEHRYSFLKLVNHIVVAIAGYSFQDLVCGTRAYTKELAQYFTKSRSFGYGIEIEQALIAMSKNKKIIDIGVQSNIQHKGTNVEKIEDNFSTLLSYAIDLDYRDDIIFLLNLIMVNIKKRIDFEIDARCIGIENKILFKYVMPNQTNAYTSGTYNDGYSLKILS